jgi:hypothetical protein
MGVCLLLLPFNSQEKISQVTQPPELTQENENL